MEIPPTISSEEGLNLSGEIDSKPIPLSPSDIKSGATQKAFEKEITRYIPFKSSALLGNAKLQKTMIELSNSLFGWKAYPTYYGSNRLWIPSQDAVTDLPYRATADSLEPIKCFSEGIDHLADEYPNINFHVLIADQPSTTLGNPAHELIEADTVTIDEVIRQLHDGCDAPNVTMIIDRPDDLDEYYDSYMKSDHHWNAKGAFHAINALLEEQGADVMDGIDIVQVSDVGYTGYTARAGLVDVQDSALDADIDYSTVSIYDHGTTLSGNDHSKYWDSDHQKKRWQFYESYWPYYNEYSGPGDGTALLICDSAALPIERYLAMQYRKLYVSYDLHDNTHGASSLSNLIEEDKPQDVYFIAITNDLISFCGRNPGYFE